MGGWSLPRLDFQLLAETKCQETLGDALEGAPLSCHCHEWDADMVTMTALGENLPRVMGLQVQVLPHLCLLSLPPAWGLSLLSCVRGKRDDLGRPFLHLSEV